VPDYAYNQGNLLIKEGLHMLTTASKPAADTLTGTPVEGKDTYYSGLLDKSLRIFFWNAFKICVKNPSQAYAFVRTVQQQVKAGNVRKEYEKQGIHIPPMMIFSVTNRCNLRCKGCYNWSLRPEEKQELSAEKVKSIIAEGSALGISFVILAGGEPLVRPEMLDIAGSFPLVQFLMFTNGTMINDAVIASLEQHRNIIPVISLEGNQTETDDRRGSGIYANLRNTVARLKRKNIFWSTSLTITRMNVETIADDNFIADLYGLGCQMFFFMEYTPTTPGTEDWVISPEQRKALGGKVAAFREKYSALFVNLPDDEAEFGGCLAAGRGFIHVAPEGRLEACPFAPFSDSDAGADGLAAALASPLMRAIRERHHELTETRGGCALRDKAGWVASLGACAAGGRAENVMASAGAA
jgi:MoaA/NifB/PqqE/SkfB family radical SAM enzyme